MSKRYSHADEPLSRLVVDPRSAAQTRRFYPTSVSEPYFDANIPLADSQFNRYLEESLQFLAGKLN